MSNNKYSITECVDTLSKLTSQNLEILQMINSCFYTKSSYVTANINDDEYLMPSFLYLENKINELENDFQNLVNAPTTGQAAFSFDGNTQEIMLQGFQNAPNTIDINTTTNKGNALVFNTESKDILKDFTTPFIYTKIKLDSLPDHIYEIDVKKITINNSDLISTIGFGSTPIDLTYQDIYSYLYNYTEDVDYTSYDTRYTLPIKTPDKDGTWSIANIYTDELDPSTFVEYITLDVNEDLTYTYRDQTLTGYVEVGDTLITYDDKCKLEVTSIDLESRKLTLRVLYGYANLMTTSDTTSADSSYLKYFNDITVDEDSRTLKLPLEEDQYVIIFVAPINSNLNVRAPWGQGLGFDVHAMRYDIASTDSLLFEDYYNDNIKNIGDIIYDISKFTSGTLSNISYDTFSYITSYTPTFTDNNVTVTQTNKHLFDNTNINNIRSLNKQKAEINNRLLTINNELAEIDSVLSSTDFSNLTSSTRTTYENKQTELNTEKNTLTNSLSSVSSEITLSANDTAIPTQSAEYAVIGYVDTDYIEELLKSNIDDVVAQIEIIKVNVMYRYKNTSKTTSDTVTIDDVFTYSSWNELNTNTRSKYAYWDTSTANINYALGSSTSTDSQQFNAINIPLTKGESVSIKVQLQYSLGYPYIDTLSNWSSVLDVDFPDELIADADIEDILEQNTKDETTLNFKNTLIEDGVTEHVQDYVVDQDITYFHKPDSISSGFYTDDTRRAISLKDKIYEMSNNIESLLSYYSDSVNEQLSVVVDDTISTLTLRPNEISQNFVTPNYISLSDSSSEDWSKTQQLNITISNSGSVPVNLYSMFYGDKTTSISQDSVRSKWGVDDYIRNAESQITKDINLYPIADTYLLMGVSNTGGDEMMYCYWTGSGWDYRRTPVIEFKLSKEYNSITSPVIKLYLEGTDRVYSSYTQIEFMLQPVTNVTDSWSEDDVNYDNYTEYFSLDNSSSETLSTVVVNVDNKVVESQWLEFEDTTGKLSEYINEAITNGDTTVSFSLRTSEYIIDSVGEKLMLEIHSKENESGNSPMMVGVANIENINNILYTRSANDYSAQTLNQYMYFRRTLPFVNDDINYNLEYRDGFNMNVYPYIVDNSVLQIDSAVVGSSYVLNSGEGIVIPIIVNVSDLSEDESAYSYVSFSLWTSRFSEPIDYTFKIVTTYNDTTSPSSSSYSTYTSVIS